MLCFRFGHPAAHGAYDRFWVAFPLDKPRRAGGLKSPAIKIKLLSPRRKGVVAAGSVTPHPLPPPPLAIPLAPPYSTFAFDCVARETTTHAHSLEKKEENRRKTERQQRVCHTELVTVPPQQLAGVAPKTAELYIHTRISVYMYVCIYVAYPLHARASPAKVIWPKRAKAGKTTARAVENKIEETRKHNKRHTRYTKRGSKNVVPKRKQNESRESTGQRRKINDAAKWLWYLQ